MDKNLKVNIGKKVKVSVRFIFEGKAYVDYIQGVLKEVNNNEITIVQHVPFSNLILGGETKSVVRKVSLSNIEGKICFI